MQGSSHRLEIESAIMSLRHLIEIDKSDKEKDYQNFFENNPITLEAVGYSEYIPHPEVFDSSGGKHIPDFIAQKTTGAWEILELKTPETKLNTNKGRRNKFYAETDSCISQVLDYIDCFEQESTLGQLKSKYGFDFHKKPRAILIAGVNERYDKQLSHNLLQQRGGCVEIVTYDEVLAALESLRLKYHSQQEGVYGMSLHFLAQIDGARSNVGYLVDVGSDLERNRVSLMLFQNRDFVFRVIDDKSNKHYIKLSNGERGYDMRDRNYYCAELSCFNNCMYISLSVNSVTVGYAYRELTNFDFGGVLVGSRANRKIMHIIGVSLSKSNPLGFTIGNYQMYARLLTFDERRNLAYSLLN